MSFRNLLIPTFVAAGLFAGFAREILLAYLYGTSREVEIFRVAFGLPSVLSDSLAVSFVAILIRLILNGETRKPAQALRRAVWAATLFAGGMFVVGVATMPWQARLLAPGMSVDDQTRLVVAGRICWITFLCVILSLPMRALMSTRGRIWPGAASQLMRSGAFVLAFLMFVFVADWRDTLAPSIAAAIGGATVLIVHGVALGRRDRRRIVSSQLTKPRIAELYPTLVAVGVVMVTQLFLSAGRLMDRAAATGLGDGMLAGLEYSYALLMAVAAILGTSANLVLAPRIGRSIRDTGAPARSHWNFMLIIMGATVVMSVGLAQIAGFIVPLVYQYGAFDAEDAALTSSIFRIHILGLGPLVLALLLTQVLLLQGRQGVVFVAALIKTAIKVLALWSVLRSGGGVTDIAITLIWTETAMACSLAAILVYITRQSSNSDHGV
jgi:peptidoglycan biosynthesis protein MviN/MurJ (putative lipid II flippase)